MSTRTSARKREFPARSLREPEVKNPSEGGVVAEEETAPEMVRVFIVYGAESKTVFQ
jgi:hypothetical protein